MTATCSDIQTFTFGPKECVEILMERLSMAEQLHPHLASAVLQKCVSSKQNSSFSQPPQDFCLNFYITEEKKKVLCLGLIHFRIFLLFLKITFKKTQAEYSLHN